MPTNSAIILTLAQMSKMKKGHTFVIGVLVVFCCLEASAEYRVYQDPKKPLNRRIKDLLQRMTLQEKIGQMVQIERAVASPEVMKKYYIGQSYLHSYTKIEIIVPCLFF